MNLEYDIDSIIANEETGLKWSWDRDKQVAEWCDFNRVKFVEHPSNGVVRKQLPRKGEFLEPEGVVELTFDE